MERKRKLKYSKVYFYKISDYNMQFSHSKLTKLNQIKLVLT